MPNLVYISQVKETPQLFYAMHMHENFSEIMYIKEGKGDFIVNNTHYQVSKGDLLIFNKGVLHQESSSRECPLKTYVCAVENVFLKGVEDHCIIPNDAVPVVKCGKYSEKVENYFLSIFEECFSQNEGYEFICQSILIPLITLITKIVSLNQYTIHHNHESALSYKIKQYIDDNYMYDIKLNDIAKKFYISHYYLSHILKEELGFSPIKYIINRRIGEAQKLLISTNMSFTDISKNVGYENVNYFSKLFKKNVGVSPGKFRSMYNIVNEDTVRGSV